MTTQDQKLDVELHKIFQEVDIKEILTQLQRLKEVKEELKEIELILQTTKCICQKVCHKKGFFCC